jgi:hypothetical protein
VTDVEDAVSVRDAVFDLLAVVAVCVGESVRLVVSDAVVASGLGIATVGTVVVVFFLDVVNFFRVVLRVWSFCVSAMWSSVVADYRESSP